MAGSRIRTDKNMANTVDPPTQANRISDEPAMRDGTVWEVLLVFLKLGLTSFGGPVAHLGYFRSEFVEQRRWLNERSYSDLVALCQFLPGPASSQVGMALGLGRAGWGGLLAAWLGFTLPSALVLILFAYGVAEYQELASSGWVHGLKVAAVAVVAQAVWGMSKTLGPDRRRAGFAVMAVLITLALPSAGGQVAAIVLCGLLGHRLIKLAPHGALRHQDYGVSRRMGVAALAAYAILLIALPVWAAASGSPTLTLVQGFYRAGALVFGGGHVVLPLLQSTVVPSGVVGNADFLAGYGAAQAVPGPLFTFAAYLGTVAKGPMHGWLGGVVLLTVVFVPAMLLVVGALPYWERLRQRTDIQSSMAGINAGVVGVLASALYDPIWTSAIRSKADFGLALAAFGLLVYARASPVLVVVLAAMGGYALTI
jgi:chromate transporter